LRTLVSRKISS